MEAVLRYISDKFDFNVLMLFVISSLFLLLMDCKEYKEKGFIKEYKFSRFFGIFFIGFGIVMFIAARFIRV